MEYKFSKIGLSIASGSGIGELMDDLGAALAEGGDNIKMLGGGQPAQIPEVNDIWRTRLANIASSSTSATRLMSIYDPPSGNAGFIEALANLLHNHFAWDIGPENICLTSGGQTAFFYLFNLLAGEMADGTTGKIVFPLIPEYIGYAAQGLSPEMFHGVRPIIEETSDHEFKYHVDFEALEKIEDISAVCVSRPTNPTGNVLSDDAVRRLSEFAESRDIPLIIDNAYGAPFPQIIFTDAEPFWEPHVILTLSLSKLGLPGTRTGIVVGPPQIIKALSSMTAITGLANPSMGQQIVLPIITSGEILSISSEIIQPYYQKKSVIAQEAAQEIFADRFPWKMHRSEGALFLWFWFPGLLIPCHQLYRRLKERDVLIIPGCHFFFGEHSEDLGGDWPHSRECIRVSFAMEEQVVKDGFQIIAEELEMLYADERSEEPKA